MPFNTQEAPLFGNQAYLEYYHHPARARLRGLSRNPAVHGDLLLRILAHPQYDGYSAFSRREWTDEAFETILTLLNPKSARGLAQASFLPPERRARLVDDPSDKVRAQLAEGLYSRWQQALPLWAYRRLALDPSKRVRESLASSWTPREVLEAMTGDQDPQIAELASRIAQRLMRPEPLSREQAQVHARDESEWKRAESAAEPNLPTDLVAALATDPSPYVRLTVSMRPELSEQQRAAIDYRVAPEDRIRPVHWAMDTEDPQTMRRCVHSAHIGLRRSVAYNRNLTPDLIEILAADEDFAVRLLLCENHAQVPGELVLRTYLEARVITRSDQLLHPRFPRTDLARLATSSNWEARKLVALDPGAPADLIKQLSHDDHPGVRAWTAHDSRLSTERIIELFHDPSTAEQAAADPNLPSELMGVFEVKRA